MADASHSDFVLPGAAVQPHGVAAFITAAAFSYSRRTNKRRLEDPFYGLWNQIFGSLIFDLSPDVFLVPQLTISDGSVPRSDPDESFGTIADAGAEDGRPDFVIMAATVRHRELENRTEDQLVRPRFPQDFTSWDLVKILATLPLAVAELKTCAARSEPDPDRFKYELRSLMQMATDQLEERAMLIFHSANNYYTRVNTLILIAACGEWWKFKIADRAHYTKSFFNRDQMDIEEDEKVEYRPQIGSSTKSKGVQRPKPLLRHVNNAILEDPLFSEMLVDDVKNAKPKAREWSRNINFGSKASNQRLYIIHELLRELRAGLGAGIPDYDSEASEDELNLKDGDYVDSC